MKTEHRKELKSNALREGLNQLLDGLKEGPSTTTLVIVLFVLLGAGLAIGWYFYAASATQTISGLWVKVAEAGSIEDTETLADKNPGTMPGRVARFQRARLLLRKGLDDYASPLDKPRGEARKKLEEAADLYEKLAKEGGSPVLVQEAWLGAAKARESLGDVDAALDLYKRLAANKPESPVTKDAAEYAKKLEENLPAVKEFYAELKKLDAEPPVLPPPSPNP